MKRIAKGWRAGMLCVLFLVITALPVGAVGPFDGVWFVDHSCPSIGSFRTVVHSVTENEAGGTYWGMSFNLVDFWLDPTTGMWAVSFGTRIDSNVGGTYLTYFGVPAGTFALTATSPATFSGTVLTALGVSCTLTGTRVF